MDYTGLLISIWTALAASGTFPRTVAVTTRIVTITVLLKSKAKTYLMTYVENVDPFFLKQVEYLANVFLFTLLVLHSSYKAICTVYLK